MVWSKYNPLICAYFSNSSGGTKLEEVDPKLVFQFWSRYIKRKLGAENKVIKCVTEKPIVEATSV